jgi:hypothetical protein
MADAAVKVKMLDKYLLGEVMGEGSTGKYASYLFFFLNVVVRLLHESRLFGGRRIPCN